MDVSEVFRDFMKVSGPSELQRTLVVAVKGTTYRIEILRCYSNPNSPWMADAYTQARGVWKRVENFEVTEREEESAIRTALTLLEDRHI